MVARAERIIPKRYETVLPLSGFRTINLFDPHSRIAESQLRQAKDYDLFPGYMKSRRGSHNIGSALQKLGDRNVLEGVMWDLGSTEYAIYQQVDSGGTGTEFFSVQVDPTPGTPTQIQTLASINMVTSNTDAADMFISGDKLYVFHSQGNFIIQWSGSAFVGRSMGIGPAKLTSLTAAAGVLTGRYTWGIELVYQVSGVDIANSTPWRKTSAGRLLSLTLSGQSCNVLVNSATLPASPGDYWTHARLWRSKRQDRDNTDPLNVIDAEGVSDELYPVALVTKATLIGAGYVINDNTPDTDLPGDLTSDYPVVDINLIELSRLPASPIGVYHRDRIWVAPQALHGKIAYTQSAGDAYGEQYNPLSVVKTEPGDSQEMIRLISFEKDLIGIKEAKTGRVLGGDPDAGFETLDHNIGVTHKKLARYVPKLGICAVTNDQGEFKILGYDLRWQNVVNEIDLSRVIRNETAAMTGTYSSFVYINGKLMIFDGTNIPYVLHAKELLGWTTYEYAFTTAQLVLSFANGTRACVISKNAYVLEIEVDDLDTDIDTVSDSQTIMQPEYTPSQFQSRAGRDVLEYRYYSVMAKLSNDLAAIPFVNGKSWPEPDTEDSTKFNPPASAYAVGDSGLEREYRVFLETRPVGQFQHFKVTTTAPCTIHDQALACFVNEAGMGQGVFDPFAQLSEAQATPDWIDTTEYDAGNGSRDTSGFTDLDAAEGVRDTSTMTEVDRDA